MNYCKIIFTLIQDELARVTEQYKEVSGGVTERQRLLIRITDELELVKQEMDERGSTMTDGCKFLFYFQNLFVVTHVSSKIAA